MNKFDDDDTLKKIEAKADAQVKILEARSKLHPFTQVIQIVLDQTYRILYGVGCFLIIVIFLLLVFGGDKLIEAIFH